MRAVLLAAALLLVHSTARAADLSVFTPGAVQSIVHQVAKDYEQKTGDKVLFLSGTAGAIAHRVADGERGDVVIATSKGIANLAKAGKVDPSTIRNLGSMGVGVAVRKGAPKPDIHDVAAFKAAMLKANSIMFANPAKGGQSGIHVAKVLKQLGIYKELQPKLRLRDRSPDGLKEVAAGTIDIGLGQISEILAAKNVVLVGPLPGPIQGLVTFTAAVDTAAKDRGAAQKLIEMLTSRHAKELFKKAGFE